MNGDILEPHKERDVAAAEYVLRLADGEELLAARGRLATDPDFAGAVEAWERRLAPMFDGVEEVPPPADVWSRIERAIGTEGSAGTYREAGGDNVVQLRRRERLWKGYAAGMTALAAGLALFLGLRVAQPEAPAPAPQPQGPVAEAPALVASLASEAGDAALAVTVSADRRSVVVTPTRMAAAAGRAHELWLIPASGTPVSLGVITPGEPRRHSIPDALVPEVRAETALAVSVEPEGGSPTGQPTGPVVASAPLRQI